MSERHQLQAGLEDRSLEMASEIFRAMADTPRLRALVRLGAGELSVGQLAELESEKMQTMSARLKVLLAARLVVRRRAGQAIYYAIADAHVLNLVENAVAHANELR